MRWPTASRERRAAIAFLVFGAVVIGAVLQLLRLGGDDGRRNETTRAPAPPTTTTTAGPTNYQVQRGDTLSGIAARFGSTVALIVGANQLTNPDRLTEGQTLVIPPVPAVELVVVPAATRAGLPVELRLRGAKPGESVAFRVASPLSSFTGESRVATLDGRVSTTYRSELTAPAGIYTVTAIGDQGTTAEGSFRVDPLGP